MIKQTFSLAFVSFIVLKMQNYSLSCKLNVKLRVRNDNWSLQNETNLIKYHNTLGKSCPSLIITDCRIPQTASRRVVSLPTQRFIMVFSLFIEQGLILFSQRFGRLGSAIFVLRFKTRGILYDHISFSLIPNPVFLFQ